MAGLVACASLSQQCDFHANRPTLRLGLWLLYTSGIILLVNSQGTPTTMQVIGLAVLVVLAAFAAPGVNAVLLVFAAIAALIADAAIAVLAVLVENGETAVPAAFAVFSVLAASSTC